MTARRSTPLHRVLHWTIAVAMGVLFITGFLRMTWMNKHVIMDTIAAHTPEMELGKDRLTAIAVAIRDPMWQWHVVFAHIMMAALLVRIIYMVAKGIRFPDPFARNTPRVQRLQGSVYLLFYLFVAVQAVTGAYMRWNSGGSLEKDLETVHKWALYWFPIFALLHLAGVVWAELKDRKGITSRMIGGGE